MQIGQILREARIRRNLTLAAVSEKSGVPKGTLSSVELGAAKDPTFSVIARIANFYEISLDKLYAKQTKQKLAKIAEAKISKQKPIPLLPNDLIEKFLNEDDIDELSVSVIYSPIESHDHCFAMRMSGNSMKNGERLSIYNDDILVVAVGSEWKSGDIVVAKCDGKFCVREISDEDDGVYLKPLNTQYPIQQYSSYEIIGTVLSVISNLK